MRPLNCGMASLAVLIGAYLGGVGTPLTPVYLAMAAAFLICGGGMTINDYYDRRLDFIHNSEKPLPSGKVSLKAVLIFTFLLFALGLYLSFWVNLKAFFLASFNSILLVAYAKVLQRRFIVSNLTISFLVASTFVFGGFAVGNFFPALLLGLLAFFANIAREIVKDLEDKYADKTSNIRSIPRVLGESRGKDISSVFAIVAVCLSPLPLIFHIFWIKYAFAVVPSVVVFLYSVYLIEGGEDPSRVQSMIKLGMILGLVAFLVGAF